MDEDCSLPTPSVVAVVVSYNSPLTIERAVRSAASQSTSVVLVDNASSEPTLRCIDALIETIPTSRLVVVRHTTNRGLAGGLNGGVERALELGAAFVLMLDDDSVLLPLAVKALLSCFAGDNGDRIGIAAARWVTHFHDVPTSRELVKRVPSSGSLIRRDVLEHVRPFREDYFVDHVDYEFCSRVRESGWLITTCPDSVIVQRPGNTTQRRLLARVVDVSHYAAGRYYLMFRNGLVLYLWEHRDYELLRAHLRHLTVTVVKIALYEEQKFRKLRAICKGILHGVLRRLPPLPEGTMFR